MQDGVATSPEGFQGIVDMFYNPLWLWAAVLAAMIGIYLFIYPARLLFVLWLWGSVAPLVSQYVDNPVVRYLDEILLLFVSATVLAAIILQRQKVFRDKAFLHLLFLGAVVLCVSFLINDKIPLNAFNAIFTYYLFPVIFLSAMAYMECSRKTFIYFVVCMLVLFAVNFILNIGWFLHINPLRNEFSESAVDFAQGTFAGAHWVSYYSIVVFFICFSGGIKKIAGKRWLWFAGGFVALLNFYLCHAIHAYLMIVLLYGAFFLLFAKRRKLMLWIALGGLVFAVSFPILENYFSSVGPWQYRGNLGDVFTVETLEHKWWKFTNSPKARLLDQIVVQNVLNAPLEWLFGTGPGMGISVIGLRTGSPNVLKYLGEYWLFALSFKDNWEGSILFSANSGIISLWSEIGLIGFVLYVVIYCYPLFRVLRKVKQGAYKDPWQRLLSENFILAILLFLMVNVVTDRLWTDYFVVGIWIWAALVWNPIPAQGSKSGEKEEIATKGVSVV